MAANNDYRSYLRNPTDIEAGHPRFQHAQNSEPTYRPFLFGTLAVMGLLQVASSVAILLHLTGYLQEVDLTSAPHRPMEEVQNEPIMADALKDQRKGKRCKPQVREELPYAHLPISKTVVDNKNFEERSAMIHWDQGLGSLQKMLYHDGRLTVTESGFYYIYANTCFRYYKLVTASPVDVSNAQLIQYIYHEKHTAQLSKPVLLTKMGSTMRWDNTEYNMYCTQQGRGVALKKGDSLFVNVSNSWMLDPEPEGTYFGVMKLSN